jgi:hypothetical protein
MRWIFTAACLLVIACGMYSHGEEIVSLKARVSALESR